MSRENLSDTVKLREFYHCNKQWGLTGKLMGEAYEEVGTDTMIRVKEECVVRR